MKKVSFHTLGCKLNYAETASLEKQFAERGFALVPFGERSDVCVINTCSVTERADRECRQLVRRASRISPGSFVVVLGCYAQLQPEEIASIDGVDLVLGASEKFNLFNYSGKFEKFDSPRVFVSPISNASDFGPAYSGGVDERTRAFLKVQDGCDFNCSFCTIPLARGKSRSQSIDDCILQAVNLVDLGYREIVLTGVNVGDFGKHIGTSLVELLKRLETIDGLERIRVSSVEPNLLTEELLEFWVSSKKICNHFHIPLQSGSDEILKRMRRRYTSSDYRNLIHSIRKASPDAGIGADVIVGFPGETDDLFRKSYDFVHELPLSYLHVFTYSERSDTPSLELDGRVEPRIRYKRSEMLRILGLQKKQAFLLSQLHMNRKVLIESSIENNMLSGYTDNYIRVFVPYHPSLEHSLAEVVLQERKSEGCIGIVNDAEEQTGRISVAIPTQQAVAR
jgi:threonylcarbamoyladenosine tRNA methylthiotransferase MtaB